jgi:hypothetical protein
VRRLLVTAKVVPNSPILVTLMMEGVSSSETSALTRVTRRSIPEDGIFHSHYWVALVRTDVSEERMASIIRVKESAC